MLEASNRTHALGYAIEEGIAIRCLHTDVESEDATITEAGVENVLYNSRTR